LPSTVSKLWKRRPMPQRGQRHLNPVEKGLTGGKVFSMPLKSRSP
jgi:hypothetical protein